MKTSVTILKNTGVTCAEFGITLLTLLVLNAVIIWPAARLIAELLDILGK